MFIVLHDFSEISSGIDQLEKQPGIGKASIAPDPKWDREEIGDSQRG